MLLYIRLLERALVHEHAVLAALRPGKIKLCGFRTGIWEINVCTFDDSWAMNDETIFSRPFPIGRTWQFHQWFDVTPILSTLRADLHAALVLNFPIMVVSIYFSLIYKSGSYSNTFRKVDRLFIFQPPGLVFTDRAVEHAHQPAAWFGYRLCVYSG